MSIRLLLLGVCCAWTLALPAHAIDCDASDVNVEMRRLLGKPENVCQSYGGKVMLIVNVASHCGFTSQYEGLEKVYKTYRDQGLVVLGFPSGDFMGQEFDDEAKIQEFCKANFGVSFPMFGKTSVKGEQANPLFKTLTAKTGEAPGWNFNKYLVGRDGKVIAHYGSRTKPEAKELRKAIESALAARAP